MTLEIKIILGVIFYVAGFYVISWALQACREDAWRMGAVEKDSFVSCDDYLKKTRSRDRIMIAFWPVMLSALSFRVRKLLQ